MTSPSSKKTLRVVAAVIIKDGRIFAAKRDYGFLKGKYEFPGGKIEDGETPEQALIREIKEELDSNIAIDRYFMTEKYEYEEFFLDMDVFLCHLEEGALLAESGIHSEAAFLSKEDLLHEPWCPADREIAEKLYTCLK